MTYIQNRDIGLILKLALYKCHIIIIIIIIINYTNQLAPKWGSQRRLSFDPNLTWWAYRAISLLFRLGTLSAGGLISPLFSPAFDGAFDQLQLIRATLIIKMQKDW